MPTLPAPRIASFLLALLLVAESTLAAVRAGPMVGDVDMHNASIWVQLDEPGEVLVEAWPVAEGEALTATPAASATHRAHAQAVEGNQLTAVVRLTGLQQGRRYAYRLSVDGRQAGAALGLRTHARWQWRKGLQPPALRVALGSCVYVNETDRDRDGAPWGGGYEIFASMAKWQPDLTLWLGDNVYFRENEYTSAEGMAYRYRHDRALPELQPLLRTGRHAAIWDDHDFGPNDANGSFVLKGDALRLFQRYWANRSYGLPELPGVFTKFSESDVDFFLLDGRTYRDSDKDVANPGKALFGPAQMRWLKNALLESTATFKVIASGNQFLNDFNRFEGWTHFKAERDEFLRWLQANRIPGVVFLSGDRHLTELIRVPRPGTYPLHDLTCSPLTAGAADFPEESGKSFLVPGTLVQQRNFCTLEFTGDRGKRILTIKSHASDGAQLWVHTIEEQGLR